MYLPDIDMHEAATLEEASELLVRYAPNVHLLAGGTDLLVDLKTGRVAAKHLVSINGIEAMRGVSHRNGHLRVGALTTPTDLTADPIVGERFRPMLDATCEMASLQIRNVATVGGNIASAVPCADLPPILMVMGASVRLRSPKGERDVPLDSFFAGPRQTALREDEVLVEVLVPDPPPRFGAAYERFALRAGNAIAVASVAAGLLLEEDGTIREARIVLGAVAPIPKLALEVGSLLCGQPATEDAFAGAADAAREAANPICDVRGSADFRRELVCVLARRALRTASRRGKGTVE